MFRFLGKWSLEITGASLVGYNMLSQQKRSDLQGMGRSITNSSRASFILFRSVYDYYRELGQIEYNSEEYHKKRSEIHTRVAHRILDLSVANKGIYLKLGQYLGNLDKVMPWEFTEVLKVLQDSVPPIAYEEIKTVIEEDLGLKPKEIFQLFNKNAVAAASLAQVHKAKLGFNGKSVAVKIQYPFLRAQSKWDLWILTHITNFCNYLMVKNNYKEVDLLKIFNTWTSTLVEELDFEREIANAQLTRKFFKDHPHLVIPKFYPEYSSERVIVMDFIEGEKITQTQKIKEMGFDTKIVGKTLVDIFADMIFKYGFVHCDAHPGNILVRKNPRSPKDFEIVLLDHGLYRSFSQEFIKDFSELWLSLIRQDAKGLKQSSLKLNVAQHLQYLPIIFLMRTANSRKRLGEPINDEERKYFREKDIANFEAIHKIIQDLPPEMMFVIKATNLIAAHNVKLGGSQRDRLLTYSKYSLACTKGEGWGYKLGLIALAVRVWLFEHLYWLYRAMYGTLA